MSNEGSWSGDECEPRWGLEDSEDGFGLGCEAALPGLQWLAPQDAPGGDTGVEAS